MSELKVPCVSFMVQSLFGNPDIPLELNFLPAESGVGCIFVEWILYSQSCSGQLSLA